MLQLLAMHIPSEMGMDIVIALTLGVAIGFGLKEFISSRKKA